MLLVALGIGGCAAPGGIRSSGDGASGYGASAYESPGLATSDVDDAIESFARGELTSAAGADPVRVAAAWEDGLHRDDPPADEGLTGANGGVIPAAGRVVDAGRFESLAFELDGADASDEADSVRETRSNTDRTEFESDAEPRSVEHYVALAVASHPKIRAARRRVAAEQNRVPQVRALPDPTFGNTFWPAPDNALQTAAGRVGNQMSLTQSVPWPEKLRTRAAVVNREIEVARAELERVEREIVEAVRLAYLELWYATRAIEVVSSSEGVVDDLTRVAEARYRSGGSQQDVLRAQLEADRLADQLTTLRRQREVAQADLAALIRRPLTDSPRAQENLGLGRVPGRLQEIVQAAERCNPELRGLAWEIERDRQRQRLACLEQYPDLQFGVSWWLIRDGADSVSPVANGRDNFSFTVGTTLPIWRSKIDGGIREAAQRAAGTRERYDAERDALQGRLRRLLAQAVSLDEQREIYRSRILPRVEDTLRIAVADYRGERADFFSVIETYRELLAVQIRLARIETDLAGTIAELERAVGCPLESGDEPSPRQLVP